MTLSARLWEISRPSSYGLILAARLRGVPNSSSTIADKLENCSGRAASTWRARNPQDVTARAAKVNRKLDSLALMMAASQEPRFAIWCNGCSSLLSDAIASSADGQPIADPSQTQSVRVGAELFPCT
jgi:hypothetical protein